MATADDYASGRILRSIRIGHAILSLAPIPVLGRTLAGALVKKLPAPAIKPVPGSAAREIIARSRCCAAGIRVCQPLFPDAPVTEAIFLDDLAERMVAAGKAVMLPPDQAREVLDRYPKNPVILSPVEGRYQEICCSDPATCLYWRIRRTGFEI